MATVDRYIDTDVSGGAGDGTSWSDAYASMSAWEAAEQTDLVTDGDIHVAHFDASSGTADTAGVVTIDSTNWTTGASNYITLQCDSGMRHDGKWNTSEYRLAPSDTYDYALYIEVAYCRVQWLQITNTAVTSVGNVDWDGGGELWISHCVIDGQGSTGRAGINLDGMASSGTAKIWNNIVYDANYGVYFDYAAAGTTIVAYNNTFCDSNSYGISVRDQIGDVNWYCKSNIMQGNGTDYRASNFSTASVLDNITEDNSGPNNEWDSTTVTFANEAGDDFHLGDGDATGAKTGGTDLSTDSDGQLSFSDDIDGDTRSDWSIGADEYVTGAVSGASTDGAEFADTPESKATFYASSTDGVELSDTNTATRYTFGTATDGVEVADINIVLKRMLPSTADGVEIGDINSVLATFLPATQDGVEIGDTNAALSTLFPDIADGTEFGDTNSIGARFSGAAVDGVEFGDTPTRFAIYPASAVDGIEFGETTTVRITIYGYTTDGFVVSDTVTCATAGTISAAVTDGISAGDTPEIKITLFGDAVDGAEFGDTASVISAGLLQASVIDGVVLSDTGEILLHAYVALSDGITLSDTIERTRIAPVATSDGVEVGDSPARQLLITGVVTDGFDAGDSATIKSRLYAAISDGLTFGDISDVLATLLVQTVDGIELSDVSKEASQVAVGLITMTASSKDASITVSGKAPSITVS